MSIFGWSCPPGCSGPPDDPEYCGVCGATNLDNCVCPECPVCGDYGNRDCYMDIQPGKYDKLGPDGKKMHHGLRRNANQVMGYLDFMYKCKLEAEAEEKYLEECSKMVPEESIFEEVG